MSDAFLLHVTSIKLETGSLAAGFMDVTLLVLHSTKHSELNTLTPTAHSI